MNITQYVELSKRTNHTEETRNKAIARIQDPDIFDLEHAIQGMQTELGEFTDVQKKYINYGKPMDWVNMAEELGDLLWYIALAARVIEKHTHLSIEDILRLNLDKLKKRFPDKFSELDAINRDVVAERKILEDN